MSALDYRPAGGDQWQELGSANAKPATGEEIRDLSFDLTYYQTSIGDTRLAEKAFSDLSGGLNAEQLGWIDRNRKEQSLEYEASKGDRAFSGEVLDYTQRTKDLLAREGAPFSYDDLENAKKLELQTRHQELDLALAHNISDWPITQSMTGAMGAVFTDPLELGVVGASLFTGFGAPSILRLMAREAALGLTTQAAIQSEVLKTYEDLGMEELYGDSEALIATLAAGILPPTIIGGVGYSVAGGRRALNNAERIIKKHGDIDLDVPARETINTISRQALELDGIGDPKELARVNSGMESMARNMPTEDMGAGPVMGRGATTRLGDDLPAMPMLRMAQLTPTVDVQTPTLIAESLFGRAFNAAEATGLFKQAVMPKIRADLEDIVNRSGMGNSKQARIARQNAAKLEAAQDELAVIQREIAGVKRRAARINKKTKGKEARAKKHRQAAQQRASWEAKRIEAEARINAGETLKKQADDGLEAAAEIKKMQADSNYVPPKYKGIVEEGVAAAKRQHANATKWAATKNPTMPSITDLDDALVRGSKDYGVTPDDRPPTAAAREVIEPDDAGMVRKNASEAEAEAKITELDIEHGAAQLAKNQADDNLHEALNGCSI